MTVTTDTALNAANEIATSEAMGLVAANPAQPVATVAAASGTADRPVGKPEHITGIPAHTLGAGGELHQQAQAGQAQLTTNQGVVISDNQNSLHGSRRGPTLLEDFILREKIMHFDHERIPERVVHARGSAAHGYFELTHSLAKYSSAPIFSEVGQKTPVFARFSTVAGGAGSADTVRDAHGFAVKFYTGQGNWDLVGNNIPVFFIQDAIKFPDLIHAVKMEPDRGFPQAGSAHDTFYDFVSNTPEAMHMLLWVMSDRGLPRSLRMMEGFGIHSFRLINAAGVSTFVKFHWRPKAGLQSLLWDEAVKLAGADCDFHRRDLYEAIARGDFPQWDLAVQLFTQQQADALPFDHLDPTKLIPEELIPLRVIGHMVLNRWPDNFFAETEQVAFCPSHLLPGMDFSDDPLLQGRLFSYLDTQLSRLGSVNSHQLPINAAKCPFANHQRDGHMQMAPQTGRVAYEPTLLAMDTPREAASGFHSAAVAGTGPKSRVRESSFSDHYSQPRQFYRSQQVHERAHIRAALIFELSKIEHPQVVAAMLGHLRHIDEELASGVTSGLGLSQLPLAPALTQPVLDLPDSPALRLIDKTPPQLAGRTIGLLLAPGSNSGMIATLMQQVHAAGAVVKVVARHTGSLVLDDGSTLHADGQLAGTPSVLFDAIALVLSEAEALAFCHDDAVLEFVRDAWRHLKAIGIDAGAETLLRKVGIKPDLGVVSLELPHHFIEHAKTRHWEREGKTSTSS